MIQRLGTGRDHTKFNIGWVTIQVREYFRGANARNEDTLLRSDARFSCEKSSSDRMSRCV